MSRFQVQWSRWRSLTQAAVLAVLTLPAACDGDAQPALCVGINPWPGYEVLYLAAARGYYRDAGVDVRVVEFASPADERRAFERGQIDLMATTAVEVLQARERGLRSPQIVQVIDYSKGADAILVRPSSEGVAALLGARVGVELSSLGSYVLARGLETHGMQWGDVETVSLDQASLEDSFRNGELDALVSYPPTSVRLLRDGQAKIAFSTTEIPREVLDVIAIDAQLTHTRAQDIVRFLRAYHYALEEIHTDPDAAYALMASREGLGLSEFKAAMQDGVALVGVDEQAAYLRPEGVLESALDRYQDSLRLAGQLSGTQRASELVNDGFVTRPSTP